MTTLRLLLVVLGITGSTAAMAEVQLFIKGADEQLSSNVRNHIGTVPDATVAQARTLDRQLSNAITAASQALGYVATRWEVETRQRGAVTELHLTLEPGARLRWAPSRIEVRGEAARLPAVRALVSKPPFVPGRPVEHPVYDTFKQRLLNQLLDDGFFDASYAESRLLLDETAGTGTAVLVLDSGTRARLGRVSFEGSDLSDELLQRLVPFAPGEPYQRAQLTQLYRQLQDSLYFESVAVSTETVDDTVNIAVTLDDAPRHRIALGAGFGTDTGPRLRLRWEQPHVNPAGHRLTSEARISEFWQELETDYRVPLAAPLWQAITARASLETRDVEDTESTIASVGLFYSDRWRDYWSISTGANFENESYRQGSAPRQKVSYLIPAFSINGLDLPEVNDPLYGHRTWATLSGSSPTLGADTTFLRATAGHERIFHLGGGHLLIGRLEAGALSTDTIDLIPASQRFFTGGDQTVRGYDFESISSKNPDGTLRGGRYLNIASLEYSFKILPSWRLALFTDSGRAYNDSSEPWRSSVGIGVRWLSPVGQIRVDLASQIGDGADGFRLHIFMGPPL